MSLRQPFTNSCLVSFPSELMSILLKFRNFIFYQTNDKKIKTLKLLDAACGNWLSVPDLT